MTPFEPYTVRRTAPRMIAASSIREVSLADPSPVVYSFGSLVTDPAEYRDMVAAFNAKGFGDGDCEWLYVDNSAGNRLDAFAAYNRFLLEARGRYVVLCHQDVLPLDDDRTTLDRVLAELTAVDPDWGVCGNAGRTTDGQPVFRITQGSAGQHLAQGGPYPRRVASLDENFMIVRRDANLSLSHDLSGFHWYGADLCIVADVLGWHSYVIDFHLFHKSTGTIGEELDKKGVELRRKYEHAFRSRWQYVPTYQDVFVSGSVLRSVLARAGSRIRRAVMRSR